MLGYCYNDETGALELGELVEYSYEDYGTPDIGENAKFIAISSSPYKTSRDNPACYYISTGGFLHRWFVGEGVLFIEVMKGLELLYCFMKVEEIT